MWQEFSEAVNIILPKEKALHPKLIKLLCREICERNKYPLTSGVEQPKVCELQE